MLAIIGIKVVQIPNFQILAQVLINDTWVFLFLGRGELINEKRAINEG